VNLSCQGAHYDPPFRLAEAVAPSVAVPYVIGALRLSLPSDGWYRPDPATRHPVGRRPPPLTSVRLWDGGAYENLGLESLCKPRHGLLGCDFLICSDASGPLPDASETSALALLKGHLVFPRLFDICGDQIRSLKDTPMWQHAGARTGHSRPAMRTTFIDFQYKIKSAAELHEQVAKASHLSALHNCRNSGQRLMMFDYAATAELFIPKGKPGARRSPGYRRFATAAEAIRFAVEEYPAVRTLGAWMKVGEERFNGDDIQRLCGSTSYPRRRRMRKSR